MSLSKNVSDNQSRIDGLVDEAVEISDQPINPDIINKLLNKAESPEAFQKVMLELLEKKQKNNFETLVNDVLFQSDTEGFSANLDSNKEIDDGDS